MSSPVPPKKIRRASPQVDSTPWKDVREFFKVAEGLKSGLLLLHGGKLVLPEEDNKAPLEFALSRVRIWKERTNNKLPLAIETSYSLALLLWKDAQQLQQPRAKTQPDLLQLGYASALIRGISGLADSLQQDRASAAPISALCSQLGIPGWLVDIRHQATHNSLPSLPVLRLAAHTFLGFFCERYWDQIVENRNELMERAADLLQQYLALSKEQGVAPSLSTSSTGITSASALPADDDDEQDDWLHTNYFSALYEPKKKKQKKPPKEEKKKKKPDLPLASPSQVALEFVSTTPQDIAYDAALRFLMDTHLNDPMGAWIDPTDGPLVEPLVRYLCQVWPGFYTALILHLAGSVGFCVSDDAEERLEASIKHLLEDKWLQQLYKSEEPRLVRAKLPLDSLGAQLGNTGKHTLNYWIQQEQIPLQEAAFANTQNDVTPWTVMENWEPCTIGTLPSESIHTSWQCTTCDGTERPDTEG